MKEQLQVRGKHFLSRFPKALDERIIEGIERITVVAPHQFISQRGWPHLRRLLLFQFLVQKKIECEIKNSTPKIGAKFFLAHSRLCLIATIPFVQKERVVNKECLIKTLQRIAPGINEVPGSFWRWLHPELPYMVLYIEMQRLRGGAFTHQELHSLKLYFEKELLIFLSETPLSLFWPFNEEEIYKQLNILRSEVHSAKDLAQVTIHFHKQTPDLLEFVINVARPNDSIPIDQSVLPHFVNLCMHFIRKIDIPFAKEEMCFSLFLPTHYFIEHSTINLLRAREQISHYVKLIVGPFRDYNGGLLEIQKRTFADITAALKDKIPLFHLFADQAFHALQPVEARFNLPLQMMEEMLKALSTLIRLSDKDRYITEEGTIAVFKTCRPMEVQPFILQAKQNKLVFTEFDFDSMRYFCVREIQNCHNKIFFSPKKCQNLRLMFLEGQPPSLSPYLAGGDIRCCTISKLLFEGLTRLDAAGVPKPAGAESIHVSEDGKLYTFQLRPSNWSNGKPVTSLDYLIGWKKVLKREWVSNRPELLFVIKNGKGLYHQLCQEHELGVQTLNSTTLQVELEYPDPYFLAKLSYPLFFPTIDDSQEPRYFNGPYVVKSYTQKDLDLEINPAFWDAKNIHFHQIQIGSGGSIEEINHYFRKREIDWIGNPFGVLSSALMCAFENDGILRKHPVKRPFVIYLNTQHTLLRSQIIRNALSLALDRAFICSQFFPNCTPLYTLLAETQVVSENVHEAQLLFKKGLDILQVEQPISPLVIHYAQLPGHTEFAHYLQTVWQNTFGLTVHIQGQPWNFFRNTLERKDFQIAGCFINEMVFDSLEFLRRFEDVNGCTNFSIWDHTPYQSTMAAALLAKGEKKLQLVQEATAIFNHETPVIPVCNQSLYFAKHPNLQGEVINVFGHVDFRFAFKKE